MRPTEPSEAEQRAEMDELAPLLKRAEAGDRSVLPQLQRALDGNPDLWRGYGDLAAHAEASLAMLAAGPNLLLAESLKRKLAALKAELGGESPSPLEKLLVERVTATWLQTNYHDGLLAQAAGAGRKSRRTTASCLIPARCLRWAASCCCRSTFSRASPAPAAWASRPSK